MNEICNFPACRIYGTLRQILNKHNGDKQQSCSSRENSLGSELIRAQNLTLSKVKYENAQHIKIVPIIIVIIISSMPNIKAI